MQAPSHLPDSIATIWNEVVERLPAKRTIDPHRLEVYCQQVNAFQLASEDIAKNGIRIEDARGATVRNPSVDVLQNMTKQLNTWGAEFAPPASMPKRRSGTMYDATTRSISAAEHLKDKPEYDGAIEAVKTLAWLIDEAQRAGLHALQSASYGTIPSYLKGCEKLQITPESAPGAETAGKQKPQSKGRRSFGTLKVV